jgi:hypothetical protein
MDRSLDHKLTAVIDLLSRLSQLAVINNVSLPFFSRSSLFMCGENSQRYEPTLTSVWNACFKALPLYQKTVGGLTAHTKFMKCHISCDISVRFCPFAYNRWIHRSKWMMMTVSIRFINSIIRMSSLIQYYSLFLTTIVQASSLTDVDSDTHSAFCILMRLFSA